MQAHHQTGLGHRGHNGSQWSVYTDGNPSDVGFSENATARAPSEAVRCTSAAAANRRLPGAGDSSEAGTPPGQMAELRPKVVMLREGHLYPVVGERRCRRGFASGSVRCGREYRASA